MARKTWYLALKLGNCVFSNRIYIGEIYRSRCKRHLLYHKVDPIECRHTEGKKKNARLDPIYACRLIVVCYDLTEGKISMGQ